jgi:hypothetical protein
MAGVVLAAGIGAATSLIGGFIGGRKAKKAARQAKAERDRINGAIKAFEQNRQAVINPYSDVKSLAGLATDLSGEMSNPYANLGVATSAAEIKMEQTDLALAATLDTLQSTGASAGGATALANAAARSKKDVAADIEKQEAQNEKLSAQGEAELQSKQMAEKARIQSIQISEGGRAQMAQAQGEAFKFQAQEGRDQATLDRMAAGLSQSNANIANANAAQAANTGAIISGIGNIAGSVIGAGGFGGNETDDEEASDRRLKKNIKKIGKSSNGLNIYSFEYIDKSYGEGTYQGVMSDEIPKDAVIKGADGFDRVDYSIIDVEFKKI